MLLHDAWYLAFAAGIIGRLVPEQQAGKLVVQQLTATAETLVVVMESHQEGTQRFGFRFDLRTLRAGFDPDHADGIAGAYIDNLIRPRWQDDHVVDGVCWYTLPGA